MNKQLFFKQQQYNNSFIGHLPLPMGNQQSKFSDWIRPMHIMDALLGAKSNHNKEKEPTENEMKKQLSDLKLYEEGMTLDDMQIILLAVDESKTTATNASFNATNCSNSQPDVIAKSPSPPSSQVDNHMMTSRNSASQNTITIGSTDSDTIHESCPKNKLSQSENDNSADELIFNSTSKTSSHVNTDNSTPEGKADKASRYLLSPSPDRNINVTHRRENSREKKNLGAPSYNRYWKITNDIFNCKKLPNDVPLKPRFVPKPRRSFPVVNGVPIIPDEISAEKNAYLTEMSKLGYSWLAKSSCNEFSWGPPIKVGIANGSLDKIPNREEIQNDPVRPAFSESQYITRETGATRYGLRPIVKTKDIYNYDNSDDDFDTKGKTKKVPKILSNRSDIKKSQSKNQNRGETEEEKKNEEPALEIIESDIEQSDTRSDNRKKRDPTPEFPDDIFPRRVVPPVLSSTNKSKKKPVSVSRPKKRNASPENNNKKNKLKKTPSGLSDKEIEKSLLTDDENELEIIPHIPPTKRMNRSIENLKKSEQMLAEEKRKREEEAKLLIAQENREKQEMIKRRLKAREDDQQQREAQQKSQRETENRYRNLMKIPKPGMMKRTELESEGPRSQTILFPSVSEDNDALPKPTADEIDMFPDNEYGTASAVESAECPICGKSFSLDKIQNHAANCNDFIQDNSTEEVPNNLIASTSSNSSSSRKLKCQVCDLETKDEITLNEHMQGCIESLTDEGDESIYDFGSAMNQIERKAQIDKKKTGRTQNRKRKH